MKTKMVRYTPETLPPLTQVQRAKLRALANRPDSEIDLSDASALSRSDPGLLSRSDPPVV